MSSRPHGTARTGRRLPRAAAALVAAAALAAASPGQVPTVWADLQVPGGVAGSALDGQGKLVSYDDGTTLHVFSSVTRQWSSVQKSAGATIRLFNDCLLLCEPGLCRAFASYTGRFADLPVTQPVTVLNAAGNNNDSIVLVQSGGTLHAFSAFTGTWASRPIAGGFATAVERHVAVFRDGATIGGMSAFEGAWVERAIAQPASALDADGTAAFATVGGVVHAFSAHARSWQAASLPPNPTFARGDDWGLWFGGGQLLAYTGLRGKFVATPSGVTGVAHATDLYALLDDPQGYVAWSAVTADLLPIPRTAQGVVTGAACALLVDPLQVRGYSALRQAVQPLPATAANTGAGTDVAFVTDAAGLTHAWSSERASWHQAPQSTAGNTPVLTTTTLALPTAADCFAFDAQTGQFVARGGPLLGLAHNPTSAPLLGYDGSGFCAFDTRTGSWRETPRLSTQPPLFRVWRTSGAVVDGDHGHAFGAQGGRWHGHALPPAGPTGSVAAFANSEVAFVVVNDTISAAGMLPELVPWQQFPHFRRVQPPATALAFSALAPAGGAAIAAVGPPLPATPVPGVGTLWLDPAPALLAAAVPTAALPVPRVDWPLPGSPALLGATLVGQLVVLEPGQSLRLTEPSFTRVW